MQDFYSTTGHFSTSCIKRLIDETNVMRCVISYHLGNLINVNDTHGGVLLLVNCRLQPATLLKVRLLHGCFSRFLNCANDTKSRKASLKHLPNLSPCNNKLTKRFPNNVSCALIFGITRNILKSKINILFKFIFSSRYSTRRWSRSTFGC